MRAPLLYICAIGWLGLSFAARVLEKPGELYMLFAMMFLLTGVIVSAIERQR